mgnify:CR=1 FL=1
METLGVSSEGWVTVEAKGGVISHDNPMAVGKDNALLGEAWAWE